MASASAPRHPTPRHPRRTDAVPTPFNVALDPPMRFMQKLSSRPAWFMAEGALDRLPPGTTLSRRYIEDLDPNSLGLPENDQEHDGWRMVSGRYRTARASR
jgi:hypothetical protein